VDQANSINFALSAGYNAPGELLSLVNGQSGSFNGITTTNSFNKRLQPVTLSAASPTATLMSFTYDFHSGSGDNGNVWGITNNKDSSRSPAFTYDALNRIASAQTSVWGNTYTIDAWANLTNKNSIPGKTGELLNAPANASNRLSGFSYDAAGDMTSDG